MLLFLFFFSLLFFEISGKRDADRLFFQNTGPHKSFIPANPLNENGTKPLKVFHERKWKMKDTKFRVSFNPLRCEAGKSAKNHTMIISLLEDRLPTEELTMEDLLLNSIVISGSKALKSKHEAALQKFQYSLIQRLNGVKYPDEDPFSGLILDMYTGHFYIHIDKPYLSAYFFDGDSGEVKFKFTITAPTARFFTVYANYFHNCPLFISLIDDNFPDWVPGKNMTIRRETPPPYKSKSTVSSVFVACVVVIVLTILTKTFIVPLVTSFILPRIGRSIQVGGIKKKFDFGSDFVDPTNVLGDEPTSPKTAFADGGMLPSREALKKLVDSVRARNLKMKKTASQKIQKTQTTPFTQVTQGTTQHVGTTQLEMNEVTGEGVELEEEGTQPDI